MGAQISTKQRSDDGKVISVHSLDNWNTQFQSSRTSNKLVRNLGVISDYD